MSLLYFADRFAPRSLRFRLILWNSVTVALIMGALGLVISSITRYYLLSAIDDSLQKRMEPMRRDEMPPFGRGRGGPDRPPDGGMGFFGGFRDGPKRDRERRPPPEPGRMEDNRLRPQFFSLEGKPLFPPNSVASPWDKDALERAWAESETYSTVTIEEEPVRVLSYRRKMPDGREGVWQIPQPLSVAYRALAGVNQALLLTLPVALLGAGFGGSLLTYRVLRPVQRITLAANEIGAQEMSRRLPVVGEDEFAQLAETFNQMLSRLETAFNAQTALLERQKQFTANASHELKTPLAIIKANASFVLTSDATLEDYQIALQEIDAAANTMTHLTQDLLLLAQADGGRLGKQRLPLPLRELLERALQRVAYREGARRILEPPDANLYVEANAEELIRVFTNLLENALRHTPAEGTITIRAQEQGDLALISIADTGVGIAPEHLPRLGERFYRIDHSRNRAEGGTGLGLSICRSIVEAHEGTMTFQSAVGQGTTVTVALHQAQNDS